KWNGRMWLADSNVWLALTLSRHDYHSVARTWFHANRHHKIAFCRATQNAFLRLLTTAAVMMRYDALPFNNRDAWIEWDELLSDSAVRYVPEPKNSESYWRALTDRRTASPKLWMDAYLAAFALAGKMRLVTTDHAFRQFPGLDVHVIEL